MNETEDKLASHLRLFLSVDIHGSLALKNRLNHNVLLKSYQEKKKLLSSWLARHVVPSTQIDLDDSEQNIQAILHDYSAEDSDWAAILETRFREFHNMFGEELLKSQKDEENRDVHGEIDSDLWKTNGDELIYSFKIGERKQLHDLVVAFLTTIQCLDEKDVQKESIRLKGTGWVAGFPIRNRTVQFPGLEFRAGEDKGADYARRDYLGPDVDAGFRLAKWSHPGLMVVSIELAELLGELPKGLKQVRGKCVGRQKLKSVWDDKPYPIIWITLPEGMDFDYKAFEPWEDLDDALVRNWLDDAASLDEIGKLSDEIGKTRRRLPQSLGLVKPYIVPEEGEDSIPAEHKVILKILRSLSEGSGGPQDGAGPDPRTEGGQSKSQVVERIKSR